MAAQHEHRGNNRQQSDETNKDQVMLHRAMKFEFSGVVGKPDGTRDCKEAGDDNDRGWASSYNLRLV